MEPNSKKNLGRNWLIGGAIATATLFGISSLGSNAPAPVTSDITPVEQQAPVAQPVDTSAQPEQNAATFDSTHKPTLSNDNYYTNVSGNDVHSPAYTSDNSVPAGATARCGDGTYSFSQHHSGTCSHHGGVASWL